MKSLLTLVWVLLVNIALCNDTVVVIGIGDSLIGGVATNAGQATIAQNPLGSNRNIMVYGAWPDFQARLNPSVTPNPIWAIVSDDMNVLNNGMSPLYPIAMQTYDNYEKAFGYPPSKVRAIWLSISATASFLPSLLNQKSWSPGKRGDAFEIFLTAHLRPALNQIPQNETKVFGGLFLSIGGAYARLGEDTNLLWGINNSTGLVNDLTFLKNKIGAFIGLKSHFMDTFLFEFHVTGNPSFPLADEVRQEQLSFAQSDPAHHLVRVPTPYNLQTVDGVHWDHDASYFAGLEMIKTAKSKVQFWRIP